MIKHGNLEASAIRGLVAEDTLAKRVSLAMRDLYSKLDDTIKPFFIDGRKLRGTDLKVMFHDCCQQVASIAPPIDQDFTFREQTRAKPKGEAYQARFVGVKRIENVPSDVDYYQIFNFTIFASRKTVTLDFQGQPFAFQYHTAERLLERGIDREKAILRLGETLYGWSTALLEAKGYSEANFEKRMVIPMGDKSGLLLGDFVSSDIYHGMRRIYDGKGCREQGVHVGGFDFMFLARTFVGEHMLSEAQTALSRRLSDWHTAHVEEIQETNRALLWRTDMQQHTVDRQPLSDRAVDDLAEIVEDLSTMTTILRK